MIDYQTAVAIAKAHLDEMNAKTTLTWPDIPGYVTVGLLEHRTEEKSYGWLFCFQSNRFIETGEGDCAIIGAMPFIVEKEAGVVRQLSGRSNIDFKVEEDQETIDAMIAYEDRLWQENHDKEKRY